MLPGILQNSWVEAARSTIQLFAVQPAFIIRTGLAGSPLPVEVALKTIGPTDAEVVNTWGLGARIITIPADELPAGITPQRFDRVQIGASVHTADYVHEIKIGDEVVGYKLYVRGLLP